MNPFALFCSIEGNIKNHIFYAVFLFMIEYIHSPTEAFPIMITHHVTFTYELVSESKQVIQHSNSGDATTYHRCHCQGMHFNFDQGDVG